MSKKVQCPFCFHKMQPLPIDGGSGLKCANEECESNKRPIPLPEEVFTHELLPIAIVGPSSSGKTYYLTALMNEFTQRPPWSGDQGYWDLDVVHYAEDPENEKATNQFIERWDRLFRRGETLDTTEKGRWYPPLLLSVDLKWSVNNPFRKRKWLLVFHDVPGEITTDDNERMLLMKRYGALGASKGIILIVSPWELPGVKNTFLHDLHYRYDGDKGSAREALKGLRAARQRKKPVAICLSQSDMLLDASGKLFETDSHLYQNQQSDYRTPGKLQLGDVRETALQVRDTFERFQAGEYPAQMSDTFKYHSYFAVSSLGVGVFDQRANRIVGIPQPLRVMDPVLWLFWQLGLIEGE